MVDPPAAGAARSECQAAYQVSPVLPLKTGQQKDKPFSRHHSLFLHSGARKAAQPPSPYAIPLRQQVLEFEYTCIHITGIVTAHACARDTRTEYRPQEGRVLSHSGLCISQVHTCTVRTSTSHADQSSSSRLTIRACTAQTSRRAITAQLACCRIDGTAFSAHSTALPPTFPVNRWCAHYLNTIIDLESS
jgi:hypothetical protein